MYFGPAGNSDRFYEEGNKSTLQAFGWLENMGLTAFEYPFGRGVSISRETAEKIAAKAREHHIAVSAHAPYFINLANPDPEKRENSFRYILDAARAVTWLGGQRVVVHVGAVMKLDRAHVGIAETEHPFTTAFTKYDVRITTHYHENNFSYSMYSVIHEGGHALYDAHPADELAYTVLGGGVSMSIHESQSRFYENIIGRSRGYIRLIAPKLRELFPSLAEVSDEALYRALNKAMPSLVRTEADELTYCLHILIRYELEQKLFDGQLSVDDLPAEWNRLYREYLGIEVPTDREGVLQDMHWSGGLFGYFPSYALGSAYGAQMLHVMKQTVDVDGALAAGDLSPINGWLEEHIWKYGGLYDPGVLLEKALGAPFDSQYYVRYLRDKYTELYGL